MMSPKISVVMTTYNCEAFVKESIDSILHQTFEDFEFIIVDDGSTDCTSEIVLSYKDPRIVYLKNPSNVGQTKSLNIGCRKSCGKYIARIDADDVAYPKRLEIQYAYMEDHPDIAVVGCWSKYINAKGIIFRHFAAPTDPLLVRCYMAGSWGLSYGCISHPTVLIRREALQEVGYYCEEGDVGRGFPQDYELWQRLLERHGFANVGQFLMKYRVLRNSDSRLDRAKQIAVCKAITRKKIKKYLPNLEENDITILTLMLEYLPQNSKHDTVKAFPLFDQYMQVFMAEKFTQPIVQKAIEEMKLFYVPYLFFTHKTFAIKQYFQLIKRHPLFIIEKKYYRKILKIIYTHCFES